MPEMKDGLQSYSLSRPGPWVTGGGVRLHDERNSMEALGTGASAAGASRCLLGGSGGMLPREIFRVFIFGSRKSVHSEPKIAKDYTVLDFSFYQ